MTEELLFGTAYYPEYMPYDRLDQDITMMKEAGMNVLRIAESTWSTLQPSEGVFDFSYIDRVIDAADRENMKVIVGTPTYAIPAWLAGKNPEIMVKTAHGRAVYGHRQKMDITNETFLFYAGQVITALVEHTAACPCVIGYQIDNETKYYDVSTGRVQKRFVRYLQEKFQTVENLNKAYYLAYWSNSISSWEDFFDMDGCVNGGLASEYDRFRRSLVAEYLNWQSELVLRYKRSDQFITHNFDFEWKKFGAQIAQDGYSYGVQPDVNHFEAAKAVTVAGCDIYHPTKDCLTGAEIAFCGDSTRCLKRDNYFVLETQAQAFKYWTPYPGQLRLHAYSHFASGADALLYWNWHSIHNGYETYWKGLLSHDLAWNPVYGEACEIGRELKKVGHRLVHLKKQNSIALVVDSHSMNAFRWFPIDKDLSYNDVVRWVYDSLYELNLECDVVDVNALDTEQYDMIVVPALYSAPEPVIEKLRYFVEEGGVLLATFRSFVADDHLSVYPDALPHNLTDVFGIMYQQFTHPGASRVCNEPVRYFAELLCKTGEETELFENYEHRYWGTYGAISKNRYGKGSAYYIGCYTEKSVLKRLLRRIVSEKEETGNVESNQIGLMQQFSWPLIVRSGVNRYGEEIHFFLHYSEKEESILCPYEEAEDLLTHRVYVKNDPIPLKDWAVVILAERK